MKKTLLLLFLFISFKNWSQVLPNISENANISVLTIGPGKNIYDKFGHSAIRVKDEQFDIVFNYGHFNFKTPNFVLKFARGKLPYELAAYNYKPFEQSYIEENRWIKEQVLNLSSEEVQQFYFFLKNNYKPENRAYFYDFFYDNCATKIYDVTKYTVKNNLQINAPENLPKLTFRNLIHSKLNRNSWGSLGINLALGSVIDKPIPDNNYMFLPEYIFDFFANSKIANNKPLVKSTKTIFNGREKEVNTNFFASPLFIFGLIALIIIYITYRDLKNKNRSKWLDFSIFLITGIAGVLMLLLWFATDHTATAQNYNVLWAFPLNLIVIAQTLKQNPKAWFKRYIKFLITMLSLLCLHWIFGVQVFAIGIIPLLIALAIRYFALLKLLK